MSDEPVTRTELERALRFLNNTVTMMRDELLQLGAQVVTLTRKLEEKGAVAEADVMADMPGAVEVVRVMDEAVPPLRVELSDDISDKYDVESPPIPCAELIPLCRARCCKLVFRLSTQDLEERQVRWDYGRPYWNLRRADDGYCVHNTPQSGGCDVYQHRPATCRTFDCRADKRIWIDYDKRIPVPVEEEDVVELRLPQKRADVAAAAKARHTAIEIEDTALRLERR